MAQARKKQKFFDVEMPIIGKETQLYDYELKNLDGRTISYDLTRLLRGKSILLKLDVKVDEDKAIGHPKELKILPYYIRRAVRKGTNYVEDSISIECKDAQVRVKPFLVTRKKVSRKVRKALRDKSKEELVEYLKTKKVDELFDEILKNKLQKSLSLKLKKVYPLSLCEIRVFKIEKMLEKTKEKTEGKK